MKIKFTLCAILLCFANVSFGQTWSSQTSGTAANLHSVQFLDANNGFVSGDAGTVLSTTNGGSTWTPVNISTSNPVNGISFISSMEGWAITGDPTNWQTSGSLWHTTNGGTSWTQETFTGSAYAGFSVDFINSTTGWVGFAHDLTNNGANLYSTTNGGTTWNPNPAADDWQWTYGLNFLNATTGWSTGDGETDGTIFNTTDGGVNWTAQTITSNLFLYGVDFLDANDGFVVGDQGTIMSTTNGGSTWNTQTSGDTVTFYGVSFVSTTTGWTAGQTGIILTTVNAGSAWTAETSGTTQDLNGIFALNSATAYAVGNGGVILMRSQANGIINFATMSPLEVFPNPAQQFFTVQLPEKNIFDLSITDITGRKILEEKNLSGQHQINCKDFSNGIYLIKAISNKSILTGKLIKQE